MLDRLNVGMFINKLLYRLNVYNYGPYVKMLMNKLLHRLNIYNYVPYAKMLIYDQMSELLTISNGLLHRYSSQTRGRG
jgi:hypothetical protein